MKSTAECAELDDVLREITRFEIGDSPALGHKRVLGREHIEIE